MRNQAEAEEYGVEVCEGFAGAERPIGLGRSCYRAIAVRHSWPIKGDEVEKEG